MEKIAIQKKYDDGKRYDQTIKIVAAGICCNADKRSIVFEITSIKKENVKFNSNTITNTKDPSERSTFDPVFYDIETMDWTTDIMAKPIKNFTIHFLVILQYPQYQNYQYGAWIVTYNYIENNIPELSMFLMEIDLSYKMIDGKLKLNVVSLLDQEGVKDRLQGSRVNHFRR